MNNTLEAMIMSDGDPCPGDVRRQSKVGLIITINKPVFELLHVLFTRDII